jgi:hypothetical protein
MASYHQGMLDVRAETNRIRDKVANGRIAFQQGLLGFDWAKLSEEQRHNRMDEMLAGAGVDVKHEGNMVILTVGTQRTQVDANKFNAAVLNKDQGFFDQVFQALGWKDFYGVGGPGGAQVQPITPGGASVQPTGTPFGKPPTGPKAAPGSKQVVQPPQAKQRPGSNQQIRYAQAPDGSIHRSTDPKAKLPQGWKVVPAPAGVQ